MSKLSSGIDAPGKLMDAAALVSNSFVKELQEASGYHKLSLIDKLFALDAGLLQPVLEKHAPQLLEACGYHKPSLIDKLFALDTELLQPVLEKHAPELLEASGQDKFDFIDKLFALAPGLLQPVLEKHAPQLLEASGKDKSFFIHRLLELAPGLLKPILEQHALELLEASGKDNDKGKFIDKLLELSANKIINLTEKTIESLINQDLIDDTSVGNLLKLTTPLIKQIDQVDKLDPIVKTLLEKTYASSMAYGVNGKAQFAQELSNKLHQVIDQSFSIKKILETSAQGKGDIFIMNRLLHASNPLNKGKAGGTYQPVSKMIKISGSGIEQYRSINDIVGTLVHESTHKAIDLHYNNKALPYKIGEEKSFKLIQSAMDKELKRYENLHSKLYIDKWDQLESPHDFSKNDIVASWLQRRMTSYPEEQYAVEILAWFTQQLASNILTDYKDRVSKEFIELIWKYLQNVLVKQISSNKEAVLVNQELAHTPDLSLLDDAPEATSELARAAKELIAAEPINIKWFDSQHGQLAFQASNILIQKTFIDKLFKEYQGEELAEFLNKHIVCLFKQVSGQYSFIDKLFALDAKSLQPILEQHAPELLEAYGKYKLLFINKLFALDAKSLQPLLEKHAPGLLEASGECQDGFIAQLLQLKDDSLTSILMQQAPELLRVCGQKQKQALSEKLVILGLEELIPLQNQDDQFGSKETDDQVVILGLEELIPLQNQDDLVHLIGAEEATV